MRVLHLSADFPDPVEAAKTKAVKALVDRTAEQFDHRVISLNRRFPGVASFASKILRNPGQPLPETQFGEFPYGTTAIYPAPPRGILHRTMLERLADEIAHTVLREEKPDLIVGHKLTVEGFCAYRIARRLGVPYALVLQGDTDQKILSARPDLRAHLGKVFHEAAWVFPFSPWSLISVESYLGKRSGPTTMLPCIPAIEDITPPQVNDSYLLSVFHLKSASRKNLKAIMEAQRINRTEGRHYDLRIIGGGSEEDWANARALTASDTHTTLAGERDAADVRSEMAGATGFVLPSKRETFGMVFIEALFCGLPIIYPSGTAVDGLFDYAPFAIGVDPEDYSALAKAMTKLVENEAELKATLADWQLSEDALRFNGTAIGDAFAEGLRGAVGQGASGALS
ncbi:glycosyltransferase [Aurantiacibacter odishensis]|uniref:glycosyltransferase n=1 Tax=Aurantiacibacter odishensis TaxID=1155476 RepID=UPI0013C4B30B|nr:glycosyltransferase [Aurantiacibacter odishensis]